MADAALSLRVGKLEARVAQLEASIRERDVIATPATQPAPSALGPIAPIHNAGPSENTPVVTDDLGGSILAAHAPTDRPAAPAPAASSFAQSAASPPPLPAPLPPPLRAQVGSGQPLSLEEQVGGRWFAITGGAAVVVAIALFVKLAYDQGWIHIAPLWRCVLGGIASLALVIAGEVLRPRLRGWGSLGLSIAGLGGMYCSVLFAYGLYDLLSALGCFGLVVATAGLGIVVGLRGKLPALTVVSLTMGALAALLLRDSDALIVAWPVHVIMLTGVGAGLCVLRAQLRALVRPVVHLSAVLLTTLWATNPLVPAGVALAFVALIWAVLQSELLLGVLRSAPRTPRDDEDHATLLRPGHAVGLSASMLLSFGAGWLAHHLAIASGAIPAWMVWLALAAASGLASLLCDASMGLLDQRPSTPRQWMACAWLLQIVAALGLALTVALDGPAESAAWVLFAGACLIVGLTTHARSLRWYSAALLVVATARLTTFDMLRPTMGLPTIEVGPLTLGVWSILLGATASLWMLMGIAWSTPRTSSHASVLAGPLTLLAGALGVLALGRIEPTVLGVGVACLVVALAMVGVGWRWRHTLGDLCACAPLALAGWCWSMRTIQESFATAPTPFLNANAVFGTVVVASSLGVWWLMPRTRPGSAYAEMLGAGLALTGAGVLFVGSTLEVGRAAELLFADNTASRGVVTLWWSVVAVGMLTAGFAARRPLLRHVGLVLLGVAGAKLVAWDLVGVTPVWRIASFLSVGLAMLGVSMWYARATKQPAPRARPSPSSPDHTKPDQTTPHRTDESATRVV